MQMLKIEAFENGGHDNQTAVFPLPEGWAVIPNDMELPNFPYGEVEAQEIDGLMTVTGWTEGKLPAVPDPLIVDRRYEAGEYVSVGNTLYRVTLEIPAGGRIAVGTNAVVTTTNEELARLNNN